MINNRARFFRNWSWFSKNLSRREPSATGFKQHGRGLEKTGRGSPFSCRGFGKTVTGFLKTGRSPPSPATSF
jgi:hypothetical protein